MEAYARYYDKTYPPAYKIACDDSRKRFEDYQKERERKLKQDEITRLLLQEQKDKDKEKDKEKTIP